MADLDNLNTLGIPPELVDHLETLSVTPGSLSVTLSDASIDDTDSPHDLQSDINMLFVDCSSGNVDIQLPAPAVAGKRIWQIVQTAGGSSIDLLQAASEDINGIAATFTLPGSDAAAVSAWQVVSDGTNWWVL